ncbi:MAG: hypothetical protein RIS25_310 [Actinomycetota bacterium]
MSDDLAPAEKYALAKSRSKHPHLSAFRNRLSFDLDSFQIAACEVLEEGRSVLVAAPTGAGKTIVAEFAVYLSQVTDSGKTFYTTPMKALSNQKYNELVAEYGSENVGLLTGDTSINPSARIVIMTTEVLRNMLYAGSSAINDLHFVILDEVHFLADKFRGPVWEEVILHLPPSVNLVSLSATVSNAEEFGDWLQAVRGSTDVIVSEDRPVPLYQHVYSGGNLSDLFEEGGEWANPPRINHDVIRLGQSQSRRHGGHHNRDRRGGPVDIVWTLYNEGLLPGIFFIFSRVGCDRAVDDMLYAGAELTTPEERDEIRRVIEERTAHLHSEDLASLGFAEWEEALLCGVAAHHAGLIPVFKETVEYLFRKKLVKVVFATDTLALGINMPARSVVIDKLEKFNGETRVPITPGEYTQLTGRAGRRGIDTEGHAVIVWRSGMNPHALGALASRRSYPLYSSFKPTYNMAVNLIERYGRQVAREILEESLAQFQADRAVVTLARDVKKNLSALKDYATAMECHLGDFTDYSSIRRELSDLERKDNQAGPGPVSVRQKRLAQIEKLRTSLRKHSCHSCPDREQHARWAERYWKLRKQVDSASREIEGKTGAIAVRFDRVCNVLTELGYLEVQNGETFVSTAGASLRRIYGERDLLVAECMRRGLWDELDAQTLVAAISCVVYEARRDDDNWQMGRLPKGKFPELLLEMEKVWDSVTVLEESARLPETPALATGLALGMQRWSKGQRLDSVLRECNLAGGDFVRWAKQVIDGLDQISKVSSGDLGDTARHAITLIRRGIVADSATL